MRLYYKCARQISQYALRALEYTETQDTSLVRQFRDWRSRLSTNELTISRERIFLRQPADMVQSNDALQRLFIFVARHGITLAWDAQRRLRSHADELSGNGSLKRPPTGLSGKNCWINRMRPRRYSRCRKRKS